ncbi:hypothetical protein O5O45_20620 [Hahella aquimaris]|uniref:hypothetical protein n=1 Tax=Hahella sp. HNIBRBA332 TaxID=3015983 RepID=UPI00273C4A3E|nr:hypothetical protein [Hahella sp. HNIBRBA332]WLQ12132.1 hypothetical protein O5O45_20620 [Hahella sp. HNIBRBA332]
MARVKQWIYGDRLSYLLFEPISRRSALIDALPALSDSYRSFLVSKGLSNQYLLYTTAETSDVSDIAGLRIAPTPAEQLPQSLPLGETILWTLPDATGECCGFRCEGFAFTGQWFSPGALLYLTTPSPALLQSLLQLADDTIIYPGRIVDGQRITSLGQEKAIAARVTSGRSRNA